MDPHGILSHVLGLSRLGERALSNFAYREGIGRTRNIIGADGGIGACYTGMAARCGFLRVYRLLALLPMGLWSLPLITVVVSDTKKGQSDPHMSEVVHTFPRRLSA